VSEPSTYPLAPYGPLRSVELKTPDGAIIQFYETQ
jgi:hypothetical protein